LRIVVPVTPHDQAPTLFPESEKITIEGTLQRVRYASDDDAWSVVVLSLSDSGREVAAVGNLGGVQAGETLRLTGQWITHRKFGEQFQVSSFTAVTPATVAGIERYLGSGLVPGIGKEIASRLVKKFGRDTLRVIDERPQRLREVEGIGPVRAGQIREAWRTKREIREVMIFLQSCGISTILASRIYSLYGAKAAASIRTDPWRLAADVPGIGFAGADAIAKNLGVAPDSPHRTEAGLLHALEQKGEEGSTWALRGELVAAAARLLGQDPSVCETGVDALAARGAIVTAREPPDRTLVALPPLAEREADAARRIARLAAEPAASAAAAEIPGTVAHGITLSTLQRAAAGEALRSRILVITGGPGTGKTTLMTAIVDCLARRGERVVLCAPTGRAAKRLQESVGREAFTIHRLLEWSAQKGGFLRDEHAPLSCDTLIVDEMSMVDITLFSLLLAALPPRARLLLVGDADQLPSVGPGNVLADLVRCGRLPVVRLTEIFRQADESSIVVNAHLINAGSMPRASGGSNGDFFFIEKEEPEAILAVIREMVGTRIPHRFGLDPRRDIQVLTPMHKGPLGVMNLNRELQHLLNPRGPGLARGAAEYRPSDRVMQLRNNYDLGVYNGDIGWIEEVDQEERTARVRFDDRSVRYAGADLDQLGLAYACSIHKSQGSEFPAVITVLHAQHFVLLKRTLLYTAVTRARTLAVLVGSRRALAMAVKNAGTSPRTTRLAALVQAACDGGPAPAG
jgi:exodeoxyribonuclease V alpha subunit